MSAHPQNLLPTKSNVHSCCTTRQDPSRPLCPHEDDASTVGDDISDSSSISSLEDKNSLRWDNFRVTDGKVEKVYEAWEMLFVRPVNEPRSKTRILGVDVKTTYAVARDGYTGVRAIPYYTQEELEEMVTTAQRAHKKRRFRDRVLGSINRRTYAQELTARLFALPGALANRLGALVDMRYSATNKTQYARREWKVVFMMPIENPIAGEDTKTPSKSHGAFMRRQPTHKDDPMQKWLLIVRGQVTKTSEDGFVAFDTVSNPWLRIDERVNREKEEMRTKCR